MSDESLTYERPLMLGGSQGGSRLLVERVRDGMTGVRFTCLGSNHTMGSATIDERYLKRLVETLVTEISTYDLEDLAAFVNARVSAARERQVTQVVERNEASS